MRADNDTRTGFLVVVRSHDSSRARCIEKLGVLLGCDANVAYCNPTGALHSGIEGPRDRAVALSADALIDLSRAHGVRHVLDRLHTNSTNVLVFGWRDEPIHVHAIREATHGALADIQPLGDLDSCIVSAVGREFTRQLAGTAYNRRPASSDTGFVLAQNASGCRPLVTCGERVTFAAVGEADCPVFYTADAQPPDIDIALPEGDFWQHYHSLVPYLIFVRETYGDTCWTSALQTTRLIIDDPLLKRRYGLLDYERLLRSMDAARYASTVAFIPWNHFRTTRRNADYFRSFQDRLSLCVHGCDHTEAEFASLDVSLLEDRAARALRRLDAHQARTELDFERVMVFPQGKFSAAAPAVLRAAGYHAAINTTLYPVGQKDRLTTRDLLAPAVTRFGGFPVFGRHYPTHDSARVTFDLAFDLYLGRPAFLVEHHEFFGHGIPILDEVVRDLHARSPGLRSCSLTDAVTRTSLTRRTASSSHFEIRFFTDSFSVENQGGEAQHYTLMKDEPDPDVVVSVAANGIPIPYRRLEGQIAFEVDVPPGKALRVAVGVRGAPTGSASPGRGHQAKVLARRALSEFRDEVLARNATAYRVAKRAMRTWKAAAGRPDAREGEQT